MRNAKLTPKIIAHRGYSAKAPENTISAFSAAVNTGAPAIELDLHQSSDGHLVVHHDYALGHPDNGSGDIFKLPFKQISKVDAGSWFNKKFENERIPRLEDIFEIFKDTIEYEIELKESTPDFINKTLDTVNNFGLLGKVEFTSPHIFILSKLKQINSKVKMGVFFNEYPSWMSIEQSERIILNTMLVLPAEVAHLPVSMINEDLIISLRKHNKRIHAADCNDIESINFAINHSCDQFSTNELELALNIVNAQ